MAKFVNRSLFGALVAVGTSSGYAHCEPLSADDYLALRWVNSNTFGCDTSGGGRLVFALSMHDNLTY